jgi:hypothetical protein
MSTALPLHPLIRLAAGAPAPMGVPMARLSPSGLTIVVPAHAAALKPQFRADIPPLATRLWMPRQLQPERHLRGESATPCEKVAEVMSAARHHSLTHVGFVTEPEKP